MSKSFPGIPTRKATTGDNRHPLLLGFGIVLGFAALAIIPLIPFQPADPDILATAVSPVDVARPEPTSLVERGRLYVPVYSSIATGNGAKRLDLTATLSIRNLSQTAAVLIQRVDYHDTAGALVRNYIDEPRTLAPLGTIEIIIAENDVQGGTGAKFLVNWAASAGTPAPLADAVMIGISGTHGFSFVSVGRPAPRID